MIVVDRKEYLTPDTFFFARLPTGTSLPTPASFELVAEESKLLPQE
jgi:hypothetical protein